MRLCSRRLDRVVPGGYDQQVQGGRSLAACLLGLACAHQPCSEPGWRLVESRHFIVRTATPRWQYEPLIERLEDVHAALAGGFFQRIKVPLVEVLLFENLGDVRKIRGREATSGFFLANEFLPEGVLVFSSGDREFDGVVGTAAHELAHRFVRQTSKRRVPSWLDEGFASYVGAIRLFGKSGAFDVDEIPWRQSGLQPVPLSALIDATPEQFYGRQSSAMYLTSWMLLRCMLADRPRPIDRFRRLLDRVADAGTLAQQHEAVSEAFDGASRAKIEREMNAAYAATMKGSPKTDNVLFFTLPLPNQVLPGVVMIPPVEMNRYCNLLHRTDAPR